MKSLVLQCILMKSMWLFCDMWYVNKCFLKLSSVVPLCFCHYSPMALLMCFFPTHASLAQWSSWNYPQCTWGNCWLNNCYIRLKSGARSRVDPQPQINYCLVEIQSLSQIWSWHPLQKHPPILHSVHSVSCSCPDNMPLCCFLLLSIDLKNKLLSGWNLEPDPELTPIP